MDDKDKILSIVKPIKLPEGDDKKPTAFQMKMQKVKEKVGDFIDDITPTFVYRLKDKWHNFVYGRFINRHWQINTDLPKTAWHDSDERILYGMMKVLETFYEKEIIELDIVNWDNDEEHRHAKKEFDEIYAWWKNYPNRQKEIDQALTDWSERVWKTKKEKKLKDFLDYLNSSEKDEEERRLFEHHGKLEEKLIDEEQEMLIRLVKIRRSMWT